jgi:hypothetical protein
VNEFSEEKSALIKVSECSTTSPNALPTIRSEINFGYVRRLKCAEHVECTRNKGCMQILSLAVFCDGKAKFLIS